MILTIKNSKELNNWFNARKNHDVVAIKGMPPVGATYEDGDLIYNEVNIAWRDSDTHEVFTIEYNGENLMSLLDFINTQQNPDPQRLAFIKLTPEFILSLLKVGGGLIINNEKITAAKDAIPNDAKAVRVGVDMRDSTIILTFSSDSLPQQVVEGAEIPQLTPWFHRERINEDRKDILLRAAYDILKRCDDGPYVEDALSTCARWDDANCDGMCLMEEIACLLELGVDEMPIPLGNDDEE